MIHLTKEEKASRFDSLQIALEHTKKIYQERQATAEKNYRNADVIGAYNKGLSDAYTQVIDDVERWIV